MIATTLLLSLFWVQDVHEELEVRLVELDVRVVNLLHKPVNGLDRGLFAVRENGKERNIDHFEEISYLEMQPGDAYESPRLLILFNFMDDPNQVSKYIDKVESYLLYKETGAWQVAIGYVAREGVRLLSPFTHEQTHWIEGILATREAYRNWNDRTLYTTANARAKEDVTRRESGDYGFETNTRAPESTDDSGVAEPTLPVSPFGNKEVTFAEKESPAMDLDPRALSRFIRLLTAYDGIKEVLVIGPELWSFEDDSDEHWIKTPVPEFVRPSSLSAYSSSNRSGDLKSGDQTAFDLQEMLTNCVKSKIRLNRLQTEVTLRDNLVSATGGSTYPCNNNGIHEAIDRFLDRAGHMYRLRYSTEVKTNDFKYRRVKVGVKGLNLITEHVNRFYPALLIDRNELSSNLDVQREKMTFVYALPWDSLFFEKSGKELTAQLAVSQRIYLDHRLVFENVRVFNPKKPVKVNRGNSNLTEDKLSIEFDLPVYEEGIYRVEFSSVDLVNGAKSNQSVTVEL